MDAQAHPGRTRHQSLRAQAKALGLKNSFLGSNELVLETVVAMRQRDFRTPAVFTTKTSHLAAQGSDYQALLQQVSVEQLSEAFPSEAWNDFMASGWAALPMPDSILDRRFLHICTLSSMADLGVTPTRADTYLNGEGHAGYDFTMGWLRNPATTPNAAFVATHPTTYRLTVGFMARQLLRAGWADDINTVRACVELTLQVYNSKLALPNPAVRQFAHTDGEFMAEGFGSIPAPQCAALTSPSQFNGQRLYRFRFYDLSTDTAQGALGELRRAAERPPPKATLPVKGGKAHQGLPGFVNFDQPPATELPAVQEPTFVFFEALTAHEITQNAVPLTPAQLCGEQAVPK